MDKTRGLGQLERRLSRMSAIRSVDAALQTTSTSGRSPSDNAEIFRQHVAGGRNPFVYNVDRGLDLWRMAIDRAMRGRSRSIQASSVAEFMISEVNHNIAIGRGMKSLSPKYAKWKEKHHQGKPILVLTGQLIGSLRPFLVKS